MRFSYETSLVAMEVEKKIKREDMSFECMANTFEKVFKASFQGIFTVG